MGGEGSEAPLIKLFNMKRITATLFATIFSIMAFQQAQAQLWLMTDGGFLFSKDVSGGGLNARAAWHFGDYDYNMVTFGGGYNFLSGSRVDVVFVDTLAIPQDTIQTSLTASLITIDADYRRYFGGSDADDYFAFYGLGGLSLWMVGTKVSLPVPEDSTFAPVAGTKLVGTNMSVRMPIGAGIDWTVRGRFWWYVEAKLGIPITQVNDPWIGNNFGVSYHIHTGARILLWDVY